MEEVGHGLLSDAERRFLLALNELGVRYMIVGMSAALLQGARGSTDDVDLWFEHIGDSRIGEAARRAGGFWVTRSQPPLLGGAIGDRFDVVLTLSGVPDFAGEFAGSREVDLDGVPVRLLPLERILHSKRSAARPKDEPGVRQIELALKILRKLED
jgi:predicted nucleotidyltransferase